MDLKNHDVDEMIFVDCDGDYSYTELLAWCRGLGISCSTNGSNREVILSVRTDRLEELFELLCSESAPAYMRRIYFPPRGGTSSGELRRIFPGPAAMRDKRRLESLPKLSATPFEVLRGELLEVE